MPEAGRSIVKATTVKPKSASTQPEKAADSRARSQPDSLRSRTAPDPGAAGSVGKGSPAADRPSANNSVARNDPDQLRFRILKRGKWQRAIKLEGIFWTALEAMAAQQGTKLTDYVKAYLTPKPDVNQTAELRAHAARWLHERLVATEERLAGFGPNGMLQAVPLPGFIIGRGLGLVAFNIDFLQLIRRVAALEDSQAMPSARLNLDAPLARIIERLRETVPRPLECGFTLTINGLASRGRVRVCIAPGPDGRDDIMGFVLALREDANPEGSAVSESSTPQAASGPAGFAAGET